ncbi:ArsR/SmtB family transcription factor [Humibacter ginsenosidimutans]|uniref:Winged helix-turn-helix transcriptional regulator n=1 Tax=Humibacter ginsenosidimutans TaxID=2599293 RepID=A0A5B8M7K4_9MICO|nr:metalloregulator ArsR/SmtB family transcription factor [Humibacter ginsenosidimutans]QDZ15984.1 winged helix-turn-helix transcriptional regulator [Humibacter ginsenosidimutans]
MGANANAESAAAVVDRGLRALADGNRRAILAAVRDEPRAVGELAGTLALSQQVVSHHLRVLRDAELVEETRDGTRHLFAVRTDGLVAVRDYLDRFWPTHLARLKAAVEGGARNRGGDPAHEHGDGDASAGRGHPRA